MDERPTISGRRGPSFELVEVREDLNKLGVFAKYWEVGKVKTRLAAEIGPQQARDVYLRFVRHLLEKLEDVAASRYLYVSPPGHEAEFAREAGSGWQVCQQSDGDLGQRMFRFFEQVLDCQDEASMQGPPVHAVLIGTDTPQVSREDIDQAFLALHDHDVVLGPTRDGGYYLVGLKRIHRCLFENVAWSTEKVFSQTCRLARAAGLSVATLRERTDVDYFQDLKHLESEIRQDSHVCDLKLLEDLARIMDT